MSGDIEGAGIVYMGERLLERKYSTSNLLGVRKEMTEGTLTIAVVSLFQNVTTRFERD